MLLESYPWLSVLPPLVAIAIAIKFRQVYVALIIGIWAGATILSGGNVVTGVVDTVDRCIAVFADGDNTRVILFSAFIGAIIAYAQRSGGMNGFIELVSRLKLISTRRRAQFMTVAIGAAIPIESSINVLVTGTISRPIFDRLKISREKLAYLCDSISAPICTLIPVNAWGAYVAGLLAGNGIEKPFLVYFTAIPLNFYAIAAIALVIFLIATQRDFFGMKKAEDRARNEGKVLRDGATPLISSDVISIDPKENIPHKASNLILPVVTLVIMTVVFMLITGKGNLADVQGAKSVFGGIVTAIIVAGVKYRIDGIFDFKELTDLFFKGVGGMIPIAILMMFAFAIGALCRDLGTGPYVSHIAERIVSPKFIPVILFVITGFIAFSTGTSWGTWGIMFPIGIGTAQGMGLELLPVIAAMMSGGVFGDHCSPISDTTLVSSMASASDHIDHVNTQLPYALTAGGIAALLFLITGLILY